MSEKQQLIQAFKSLDFEALHNLLDNKRSYMEVPKDLFLSKLKQEIDRYIVLNFFEKVIEGTCDHCNKGCKAYKFTAENLPSLNLFFEENEGRVTDIYICSALKVDTPDGNDWNIYLNFFEEEKVNFEPSLKYHLDLQKVENATEDFNSLAASNLVTIQELIHWYNKYKSLADELNLNNPFESLKFKAFEHLDSLYSEVSLLIRNFNKNHLAQEALREYKRINRDDEKSVISWLLSYKDKYFFPFKKTKNWKKTGFIILETDPNLIIDCIECLDFFLFEEIYSNIENEIMEKYKPTEEHFEQNGGNIEHSLESYLKLHNKYLDLF